MCVLVLLCITCLHWRALLLPCCFLGVVYGFVELMMSLNAVALWNPNAAVVETLVLSINHDFMYALVWLMLLLVIMWLISWLCYYTVFGLLSNLTYHCYALPCCCYVGSVMYCCCCCVVLRTPRLISRSFPAVCNLTIAQNHLIYVVAVVCFGWCCMMRLHCFVLIIDIGYSWCLNVEQLILELYAVCKPLVLLENTDNSRLIDCCLLYVAMPCYGMMLLEACFYELNILYAVVWMLVGWNSTWWFWWTHYATNWWWIPYMLLLLWNLMTMPRNPCKSCLNAAMPVVCCLNFDCNWPQCDCMRNHANWTMLLLQPST